MQKTLQHDEEDPPQNSQTLTSNPLGEAAPTILERKRMSLPLGKFGSACLLLDSFWGWGLTQDATGGLCALSSGPFLHRNTTKNEIVLPLSILLLEASLH